MVLYIFEIIICTIIRVKLLPYANLSSSKYEAFAMKNTLPNIKLLMINRLQIQ